MNKRLSYLNMISLYPAASGAKPMLREAPAAYLSPVRYQPSTNETEATIYIDSEVSA